MSSHSSLDGLTDQALLDQFGRLVHQDHHHTLALLRHIEAIDRRKLWAKYGHPSMFDLCVSRYHMSESTAGKRIGAARTARRFPILFEMVGRGEMHLSGVHRLKAHLTPENHEGILAQAKHKTIREIEKLVAHLAPRPDIPSRLRALPERSGSSTGAPLVPATSPAPATSPPYSPTTSTTTTRVEPPRSPAPPAPRRAPDPEPLAAGRYKLQVTIDEATHQKLEELQDLLAHKIPNGDPAAIICRALDTLLTEVRKTKLGAADKPRTRKLHTNPLSRAIPAAFKREVWARDQGRCSFVGADGHQCNETRGLEFAHREPWAKGGEHSADNLCLRCRAHNAWEAERDFGAGFMAIRPRARERPYEGSRAAIRHLGAALLVSELEPPHLIAAVAPCRRHRIVFGTGPHVAAE